MWSDNETDRDFLNFRYVADIAAEMMRLALQVIARTLFDTEVTAEIHEINDQVNIIMDLYHYLITLPRAELLLNWPLKKMRRFRAAIPANI